MDIINPPHIRDNGKKNTPLEVKLKSVTYFLIFFLIDGQSDHKRAKKKAEEIARIQSIFISLSRFSIHIFNRKLYEEPLNLTFPQFVDTLIQNQHIFP